MSEAFIVRRGGAGTGKFFACISVTYDADGVCTCTDGVKTFTADGVNGKYVFHVPYAGEWTLTSVSSSRTLTKTVTVENQFDTKLVNLKEFLLYDNGTQIYEWEANVSNVFKETYMEISGASGTDRYVRTKTTNLVHVEYFSELCIEYMHVGTGSRCLMRTGLYGANGTTESVTVNPDAPTLGERLVLRIPVDSIAGDYVVGIHLNTSTSAKAHIFKVWLE